MFSLNSLGQPDHVVAPVEDGIVLPDEDITQDPELVAASTEASRAARASL